MVLGEIRSQPFRRTKNEGAWLRVALKKGHILEGIGRRVDPKAGGVKKRSHLRRYRKARHITKCRISNAL